MFDPAFNWAEKHGHAWAPRVRKGGYPLDLDASLRIVRTTKYPLSASPFPNPATFPGGNGIGALGMFMAMQDAFVLGTAYGKSPWGPGVNTVPAHSTFWSFTQVIFPTLPKTIGQ